MLKISPYPPPPSERGLTPSRSLPQQRLRRRLVGFDDSFQSPSWLDPPFPKSWIRPCLRCPDAPQTANGKWRSTRHHGLHAQQSQERQGAAAHYADTRAKVQWFSWNQGHLIMPKANQLLNNGMFKSRWIRLILALYIHTITKPSRREHKQSPLFFFIFVDFVSFFLVRGMALNVDCNLFTYFERALSNLRPVYSDQSCHGVPLVSTFVRFTQLTSPLK